jgi:large subunit ribosomal protein L5
MTQVAKARLASFYNDMIKPQLQKEFNYKNVMEVPKLLKIVVSTSVKDPALNQSAIEVAQEEIFLITGQKPVITKAKQSIAGFKIREGMPLGCKVTLRHKMMYEFIDRLVNIALPRVRDFRGVPLRQISDGNLSIGLKEQLVFPEINYDKLDKIRGMNITLVTNAQTKAETKVLLEQFGIPFIE